MHHCHRAPLPCSVSGQSAAKNCSVTCISWAAEWRKNTCSALASGPGRRGRCSQCESSAMLVCPGHSQHKPNRYIDQQVMWLDSALAVLARAVSVRSTLADASTQTQRGCAEIGTAQHGQKQARQAEHSGLEDHAGDLATQNRAGRAPPAGRPPLTKRARAACRPQHHRTQCLGCKQQEGLWHPQSRLKLHSAHLHDAPPGLVLPAFCR